MFRLAARPCALAFLALVFVACERPSLGSSASDPLSELEAETGHPWTMRLQPIFGTPAFLEGATQPLAVTPSDAERAAREFFTDHLALFSMRSAEDELSSAGGSTDELGYTHTRFTQRWGGVPVWGGMLIAHFNPQGALIRVNGRYAPITDSVSTTPVITEDAARITAAALARQLRPTATADATTTRAGELVLVPSEAAGLAPGAPRPGALAWHIIADVSEIDAPLALETLIDASSGDAISAFDDVAALTGSGIGVFGDRKPLQITQKTTAYWLEDPSRGTSRTFSAHAKPSLPGSELRSSNPQTWDAEPGLVSPGAAVDAHAYVALAWDYFLYAHGRNGWDGAGTGVRAVVHFGDQVPGAYFDGVQLFFGDGDASMTAPSASLDVVAHEYTHGVIASSAALVTFGEPSAIAEGFADLFACLVAWDTDPTGRWQIGETVYHPNGIPQPLRDLANPAVTGQPESVAQISAGDDPHLDASIVAHLGYLLVEGEAPVGTSPAIDAVGAERGGQLFYRALADYLFPQAGFDDFADALTAAGKDLGPDLTAPVAAALARVGL